MTSAARPKIKSPHWQRRQQVYAILSRAPDGATYSQLMELVRSQTGKACSRKLISQWKKSVAIHQLSVNSKQAKKNKKLPPDKY